MSAGTWNITIEQGATFSRTLTYTNASGDPVDLTGYTARLTAVTSYGGDLIISLTTENGRIELDENGTITLTISATDTAALAAPADGVYDLELEAGPGGTVVRLLQGTITISPEATAEEPGS